MEGLVVVRLGGGIVAELETVQGNAKRTEGRGWEQRVIPSSLPLLWHSEHLGPCPLPVIERVADVHVVGELFPQGGFELALGLDGLQRLAQLPLSDFFQTDGILQLAVQELSVLLQTTDLVLQTLKLHLGKSVKDVAFNEFWIHSENKSVSTGSGGDELSDGLVCDKADRSKRMAPFKIMLIKNTSSESPHLISSKLIGFGNPFHIEALLLLAVQG